MKKRKSISDGVINSGDSSIESKNMYNNNRKKLVLVLLSELYSKLN